MVDTTTKAIPIYGVHLQYCNFGENNFRRNETVEDLKSESTSFQNSASSMSNESSEKEIRDKECGDNQEYENNVRHKILEASLNFVAEHGWTRSAITAGTLTAEQKRVYNLKKAALKYIFSLQELSPLVTPESSVKCSL